MHMPFQCCRRIRVTPIHQQGGPRGRSLGTDKAAGLRSLSAGAVSHGICQKPLGRHFPKEQRTLRSSRVRYEALGLVHSQRTLTGLALAGKHGTGQLSAAPLLVIYPGERTFEGDTYILSDATLRQPCTLAVTLGSPSDRDAEKSPHVRCTWSLLFGRCADS